MSSLFGHKHNLYLFPGVIDFSQVDFWIAAASICFNPLYWNLVAQNEYRNKTITKLLRGNRYLGCYLLGASIFLLGILRDHLYNHAIASQPANALLLHPAAKVGGAAIFAVGQVFVITSMWALGVTGTYLGDYFGILMPSIVTGFPFNVVADPMYVGSSMCFFGVALWFGKPAGVILSVLVVIVYIVAMRFEGPFTANIYATAAREKERHEKIEAIQAADGPARGTRSHGTSSPAPKATRRSSRKRAD
ncbi:putative OPI3-methylene-fatty-acyl-phospholipid synthase [Ceraceosorus guamensis]|uniref:Phosphatidyl-N-methylethanolamine N-methyltransferase n=1 Tax=Ceraceosorus guamensis TaxID=1522189 RepID=A0A316W7M9_9BASI|nr:putative OPI3-methylene-fatty-acyl-phospholipid synthase [Ceraceosorus guamensis]PWN45920.1 putative OPI3-methylene-fatty-acyl-phospholipid synthase [Ceraceosorus guamensis]